MVCPVLWLGTDEEQKCDTFQKTSKNVTVSDDGFLVPWNSGQPAIIRLTPDQSQAKKFDASHNFMGVCDNQFISYDGNFRDANGALLFKGPDVEIE